MHRLQPETVHEPQRKQVEIAVHEAVQAAELRLAELARLVVHHLLAYFGETGIFGQVRDIAVHLAVHLDILHHIYAIGFQAAVEVVEILDAAHAPRRSVEEFCGNGFREGVVAFLLIARHEVVAVLRNHAVQFGNLVGRVLQVGVHRNHHAALRRAETAEQGGRLAIVAAELDAMHAGVLLCQSLDDLPRSIGAAVVHKNDFVGKAVRLHHAHNPIVKFRQALGLVVERHDHRNVVFCFHIFR